MKSVPIKPMDAHETLKAFTAARIALGRVGYSIPLAETLQFKLAHAHARDAVYSTLNTEALIAGLQYLNLPVLQIHSRAQNRQQYLQRPDLGRQPGDESFKMITENAGTYDISIILGDGLSANAVNNNALSLLNILIPLFSGQYTLAPVCLAQQARVALGDYVAFGLQATLCIMLIGERPGLSSPDSLGAYITYNPQPGLTDESRNCVSNIRQQGLSYKQAAEKIFYLVAECFKRKLSGINIKDNAGLLNE